MAETKDTKSTTSSTTAEATVERDPIDLGVKMLPGRPDEPVGPEDALGEGPKRGDYADRIGPSNYQPHEVTRSVADDGTATVTVTAQRPRVEDLGDAPGKGGVTTASTGK